MAMCRHYVYIRLLVKLKAKLLLHINEFDNFFF